MLELTINSASVLSPVGIEPGTSINNAIENIADLHWCKKVTHYKSMVLSVHKGSCSVWYEHLLMCSKSYFHQKVFLLNKKMFTIYIQ